MDDNKFKNIIVVLIAIVVALFCIAVIAPKASDVKYHEHTIMVIDKDIDTTLKLTGAATGASALISLLPNDSCTPISEELAELAKYFLIVLSALYLEKYLVTITGFAAFMVLIPVGCLCFIIGYLLKRDAIRNIAVKIVFTALAVFLIIPVSVKVSDYIYTTYENSIQDTIDDANEISIQQEESGFIKNLSAWILSSENGALDYVTNILNNFIEALAVMIVTSCLIPVLVFLLFIWIIKLIGNGFSASGGR